MSSQDFVIIEIWKENGTRDFSSVEAAMQRFSDDTSCTDMDNLSGICRFIDIFGLRIEIDMHH